MPNLQLIYYSLSSILRNFSNEGSLSHFGDLQKTYISAGLFYLISCEKQKDN